MGIFKGKIDIGSAFTNILDKVDDSKMTSEEKNRFNMVKADKLAELAMSSANENSIKSRSRRFASYSVIINFFAIFWVIVVLYILGYKQIADDIKALTVGMKIGIAFLMVIAFYFGGYYATNIIDKVKLKK